MRMSSASRWRGRYLGALAEKAVCRCRVPDDHHGLDNGGGDAHTDGLSHGTANAGQCQAMHVVAARCLVAPGSLKAMMIDYCVRARLEHGRRRAMGHRHPTDDQHNCENAAQCESQPTSLNPTIYASEARPADSSAVINDQDKSIVAGVR
jgi:hypothetical protein